MGQLAQGFGFTDAGTAAQASLGQGALSVGTGATSDVLGGIGQLEQFNYRGQVAANNAKIERANMEATLAAGQTEESMSKLRTGVLMGAQKAAQGANGVDVRVGSAPEVRQSTANVGAIDAAMIHYNAARAAFGQAAQAANYDAQAQLDRRAGTGALIQGLGKAGSSILSGASSLSAKYAQYLQSGAIKAPSLGSASGSGDYSDKDLVY